MTFDGCNHELVKFTSRFIYRLHECMEMWGMRAHRKL